MKGRHLTLAVLVFFLLLLIAAYFALPDVRQPLRFAKRFYFSLITKPPKPRATPGERVPVAILGKLVRNEPGIETTYAIVGEGWRRNLDISQLPLGVVLEGLDHYVYVEGVEQQGEFFLSDSPADIFRSDVVFASHIEPL